MATLAYGYRISVSTAQMARAYAAIGSGGINRPLTILKQDGKVHGDRVFEERNAYAVLEMMESVFERGGTARRVKLDGYRVGAKTGTSKKRHLAVMVMNMSVTSQVLRQYLIRV